MNIKYFGAQGNGRSNDAAAFRKAVISSSKVFLPDNIEIVGEEGTIILGMFNINGKENISIEGVEFRSWNQSANYGIRLKQKGAKNLTISNCKFNQQSFI